VKIGASAVDALARCRTSSVVQARQLACEALARIGHSATGALADSVLDPDPAVRGRAIEGLRAMPETAVWLLIRRLSSSDAAVRQASARALGEIGNARACQALADSLREDPEPSVRAAAARALGQLPGAVPQEALRRALGVERDGTVFGAAQAALGWREAEVAQFLAGELGSDDWRVAWQTVVRLGEIGPVAVPPLICALRDGTGDVRWRAASALGRIGDQGALEPLLQALHDEEPHVAAAAQHALVGVGAGDPNRARTALENARTAELPSPRVRYLIDNALVEIKLAVLR
jgi:HEAT repeat protein